MRERSVVVTGMGVISPIGNSVAAFWDNLTSGNSGIGRNTRFNVEQYRCQVCGQVKEFCLKDYFPENPDVLDADLSVQYGVAAAKMALADANISENDITKEDWGIFLAQTVGGSIIGEAKITEMIKKKKLIDEKNLYMCSTMESMLFWFSKIFGFSGFAELMSTGCAAGTDAIGYGFHLIRDGFVDIAVVGGMEAPLAPLTVASFDIIGGLAQNNAEPAKASCPFSIDRDGFVPSEGSGILIIEELEHAVKRGAKIYGEIKGYGNNSNAYHMTAPLPNGEMLGKVILEAINDAGVEKTEVGYINAHGSSTPLNDISETKAIKFALQGHAYDISINSNKSIMGHPLGAAGALEFITVVLSVNTGIIPPTINLLNPDPQCDLDYTPNEYREKELSCAISTSSGFGGVNCALLAKKY